MNQEERGSFSDFFFLSRYFFHEHSRLTGKGEVDATFLTPLPLSPASQTIRH